MTAEGRQTCCRHLVLAALLPAAPHLLAPCILHSCPPDLQAHKRSNAGGSTAAGAGGGTAAHGASVAGGHHAMQLVASAAHPLATRAAGTSAACPCWLVGARAGFVQVHAPMLACALHCCAHARLRVFGMRCCRRGIWKACYVPFRFPPLHYQPPLASRAAHVGTPLATTVLEGCFVRLPSEPAPTGHALCRIVAVRLPPAGEPPGEPPAWVEVEGAPAPIPCIHASVYVGHLLSLVHHPTQSTPAEHLAPSFLVGGTGHEQRGGGGGGGGMKCLAGGPELRGNIVGR